MDAHKRTVIFYFKVLPWQLHALTVGATVMKNWDPLVFGPAFAILSVNGLSCFSVGWNSSSNSPPQIDSPPVPTPNKISYGQLMRIRSCSLSHLNDSEQTILNRISPNCIHIRICEK